MAKYKVKCYETAVYEFEVNAKDDDDAWFKAHDVLLGEPYQVLPSGGVPDGIWGGAIRLVQPDDTPIQCEVTDREWDITEEE